MVTNSDLDEARLRFEREWSRLRRSWGKEVGREPRARRRWALPVMALAAGVALAFALKGRKSLKSSN